MKSFLLFFCVFFLVACGDTVHNHYYVVNDGEIIPCPDNDCEGIFHPDENSDDKNELDNEQPDESIDFENDLDEEATDSDSSTEEPEDILPDEDTFMDFCVPITDPEDNSIAGDYKDADDFSNDTTALTIILSSQEQKNNCLVCFYSTLFSELNGLCVETTNMPIKKLPLKFNNVDCYLSVAFFDTSNILHIHIWEIDTLNTLFEKMFIHK